MKLGFILLLQLSCISCFPPNSNKETENIVSSNNSDDGKAVQSASESSKGNTNDVIKEDETPIVGQEKNEKSSSKPKETVIEKNVPDKDKSTQNDFANNIKSDSKAKAVELSSSKPKTAESSSNKDNKVEDKENKNEAENDKPLVRDRSNPEDNLKSPSSDIQDSKQKEKIDGTDSDIKDSKPDDNADDEKSNNKKDITEDSNPKNAPAVESPISQDYDTIDKGDADIDFDEVRNVGNDVKVPQDVERPVVVVNDGQHNDSNSHFFSYLLTMMVFSILLYLIFHNRKRIIALVVEGRRRDQPRRSASRARYHKLDNNLEDAMWSNRSRESL